tara:strand:- start:1540 stop:3453 length:1914 start_codon:yes stop_codon:yes gene_type:complete
VNESLIIKRFIVTKTDNKLEFAFDEKFHEGVNIIRGENSRGKSTIANLIYYSIGGDVQGWSPEVLRFCEWVYVEIEIGSSLLTLRRRIDSHSQKDMHIFYGSISDSMETSDLGWKIYPYSKSVNDRETFSKLLFRALDFPLISSAKDETITMHQILRLVYIEQLSSLGSLLENEDWDSPEKREMIRDILIGAYDSNLYALISEKQNVEKDLSYNKSRRNSIRETVSDTTLTLDKEKIQASINECKKTLEEIQDSINKIKKEKEVSVNSISADVKAINEELSVYRKTLSSSLTIRDSLEVNISNSILFVQALEKKIVNIKESLEARKKFAEIDIKYCPSCFEELEETKEGHCKVCKSKLSGTLNSRILRQKEEIEMQIIESKKIIKIDEEQLKKVVKEIKSITFKLNAKQKEYENLVNYTSTSFDKVLESFYQRKGLLEGEVNRLFNVLEITENYVTYNQKVSDLSGKKVALEEQISAKKEEQAKKSYKAISKIKQYTFDILKADRKTNGEYWEKSFGAPNKLTLDFRKNKYSLNSRDYFSASSLIILKNAIRYAIFFTSLELDYVKYPRFILCDNTEDKGMQDERSHVFQNKIVDLAKKFEEKKFQIIYTTSKISEDLDKNEYTIGDDYTNRYTLNI